MAGSTAYYLTQHAAFRGIGIGLAKVARLSKTLGDGLVPLLDHADIEKLSSVLGEECAGKLIQRWQENAQEASVAAFLDTCGADVRLAARVLRFGGPHGREVARKSLPSSLPGGVAGRG